MSGITITNDTGTPNGFKVLDGDGNDIQKTVPICNVIIQATAQDLVTATMEVLIRRVDIKIGIVKWVMRLGDDFEVELDEIRLKDGRVVKLLNNGSVGMELLP